MEEVHKRLLDIYERFDRDEDLEEINWKTISLARDLMLKVEADVENLVNFFEGELTKQDWN